MEEFKMGGLITQIGKVESGTSKAGKDWKKTSVVIDNGSDFNNIVCFTVFGEEKVDNLIKYNKVGTKVEISFNVSSREYEGKYYSDISAWKIMTIKDVEQSKTNNQTPELSEHSEHSDDDLPF